MKRKVCILTSVHPPFDTRIFHKQAKSLLKAGHDVTLIAQHDKDEIADGVKIVALGRALQKLSYIPLVYDMCDDCVDATLRGH